MADQRLCAPVGTPQGDSDYDKLMRGVLNSKSLMSQAKWREFVTQGAVPPRAMVRANQTNRYSSTQLEEMVRMRLRSADGSYFKHWHMHKINDEKVIVLVVTDDRHVVLEDEWPLFPSDRLITALRLLEK